MNWIPGLFALIVLMQPLNARRVRVDFDHQNRFSQYKTYSWAEAEVTRPVGELFPNELMQDRVRKWIDEAMAARHLKRVDSGGDILLSYRIDVMERLELVTYTSGSGFRWDGSAISTTVPQAILLARLVLNFTDARRGQLVFQGVATQTVSSKPEKNTKKLAKAVREIFEKASFFGQ